MLISKTEGQIRHKHFWMLFGRFMIFFPVNVFFLTAVGNSFCNLCRLATPYSVYLNYIKGGTLKYLDDIRPEPSFPKQFMVLGAKI